MVRWLEQLLQAQLSNWRSVATIQGAWHGKAYLPSAPLCTEREVMGSNPETVKKIYDTHLFIKGKCFTLRITSLTNLPSELLFALKHNWKLLSFSHIFLQSYGEKHNFTRNFTSSLLILLYYPVHRALVKGLKPLLMRSWYTSIHNSQLLLVALLSSCLDPRVG